MSNKKYIGRKFAVSKRHFFNNLNIIPSKRCILEAGKLYTIIDTNNLGESLLRINIPNSTESHYKLISTPIERLLDKKVIRLTEEDNEFPLDTCSIPEGKYLKCIFRFSCQIAPKSQLGVTMFSSGDIYEVIRKNADGVVLTGVYTNTTTPSEFEISYSEMRYFKSIPSKYSPLLACGRINSYMILSVEDRNYNLPEVDFKGYNVLIPESSISNLVQGLFSEKYTESVEIENHFYQKSPIYRENSTTKLVRLSYDDYTFLHQVCTHKGFLAEILRDVLLEPIIDLGDVYLDSNERKCQVISYDDNNGMVELALISNHKIKYKLSSIELKEKFKLIIKF